MRKAEIVITIVLGILCAFFFFLIHQRTIAPKIFKAPKVKSGFDVSVRPYRAKERYDTHKSVLANLPSLPLEKGWNKEDGLWVKINGSQIGEHGDSIIAGQGDGRDNNANALFFPDTKTKYAFSADFKLMDRDEEDAYTRFHTSYFGLYLRYQDYNNFVRVDCAEAYRPAGKQFIRLLIRNEGDFIAVKHIPMEGFEPSSLFDAWHTFAVKDSGKEVVVFLDNKEILKTSYSTSIPAGRKGFLANIATRALFKNVKVIAEP